MVWLPIRGGQQMRYLGSLALIGSVLAANVAYSAETGRIKRPSPDASELERVASETAMNDSLLQKGDIVVTHRGFFVFRGVGPDGYTYEFSTIPNPITGGRAAR
ncbi:hypothetical protein CQ12_04300 [Bradyrhizobium jicamae]|uniref:Uncharacterized protein n=1 Tax=Bradyrhizobium jicamae TaxID=280332 RepID=A0A0R3KGK2_9BRAD|nr:hypothetical protein [Bradyrhizobium jicamae]KRQ94755.1 hypothetical protein CQ12_04300 [Bradyrhizobium jicamae]